MSIKSNNLRRFEKFEIDLEKKILWVKDSPVELPVKAVELLCVLIENEGKVVSKKELLDQIWQDSFVEEGVLPQNVYLLRKTFKKHGSNINLIQTVARRGYRFTGNLKEILYEEELTFERETIEHKFIAEAEFSEEELEITEHKFAKIKHQKPLRTSRTSRKTIYLLAGIFAVLVISFLGLFTSFQNYFQINSANSINSKNGGLNYERLTDSGRGFYVGLSPDNQNAAYVVHTHDDKYSLILHHLATKSETVIVPPQDLHLFNIQFSPDGNYIYYGGQLGNKLITAYRIPLYGGPPQVILKDFAHLFSVSPDGEWLAFYSREPEVAQHLEICRSRDGSERRIVSTRKLGTMFGIWGTAPSWSPNGQKFLATVTDRIDDKSPYKDHLVEIDIADGRETPINAPDWYSIGQPYWESDGHGIFVLAREKKGDPAQIWHLEYPSGTARNWTNDTNEYREFRPASDSSFIIAATRTTSENLFLVSVDDPSQVRQLTFDTDIQNGAYGLKWTIDGKYLLYTRTKAFSVSNIWILDPETLEKRQITNDENSLQSYLDVTPDGKAVVFGSNRAGLWHIWQIDLDGENLQQITDGKTEAAPEISPDGKWLYYVGFGLWKKPVGGGEATQLMKDAPGTTRISPTDPKQIVAFYSDPKEKKQNNWKFILFSEDDPGNFKDLNIQAFVNFDWKPDGSGIYFADRGESFNNLWFVSVKDLKKQRLTDFSDQRISNLSLSPDGKTFAISRGASTGHILKINGHQ